MNEARWDTGQIVPRGDQMRHRNVTRTGRSRRGALYAGPADLPTFTIHLFCYQRVMMGSAVLARISQFCWQTGRAGVKKYVR